MARKKSPGGTPTPEKPSAGGKPAPAKEKPERARPAAPRPARPAPLAQDLRHLVDALPWPVLVVDPQGEVLYSNPPAEQADPRGAGAGAAIVWREGQAVLHVGAPDSATDVLLDRVEQAQARAEELLARAEDRAAFLEACVARAEERERFAQERAAQAAEREVWARERVAAAEERAGFVQEKVQHLEEQRDWSEQQLKAVTERLNRTQQHLEHVQAELQQGEERTLALAREADQGHQRIAALEEAVDRARAERHKLDEEVQALRASWQEASERLELARQHLHEHELTTRLAYRDELTGLPNRHLMRRCLEGMLAEPGASVAVIVLDLDHFKMLNDTAGSAVGNELLEQVGRRLETVLRGSDPVGRLGEDEFAVLMPRPGTDPVSLRELASGMAIRLTTELSQPFTIRGQKLYVRASQGVSLCPGDAGNATELLEHADTAMYLAKELGRGGHQFYTPDLRRRQERRLALESQLRQATEKREFRVEYQPVVELATGRTVGAEALLRWQHRTEGLLAPERFLDVAEEIGLMPSIGAQVLDSVAGRIRSWTSTSRGIFLSVNLSARQLLHSGLLDLLTRAAAGTGALMAEIPESLTGVHPDLLGMLLAGLAEAGIPVVLDGFGSGYSSLGRMNLDALRMIKIDRSLVAGLPEDRRSVSLVTGAISLAHSLRVTPLAVGVETSAQAEFLRANRCNLAQGFFFSQPVPAEAFESFLSADCVWRF